MFRRSVNILKSNSFFLFGPRGTGKTTYLKEQFFPTEHGVYWVNLLDPIQEDQFAKQPGALKQILDRQKAVQWVVIDEVQKLPRLLDVAHQLIEESALRFALTGSSARKLKRGAANLLAGRAFVNHLYPLTADELGDAFDLLSAMQWGTLPKVVQLQNSEAKGAFLRSYALTYLKEEVQTEQLVRRLDPFRKFLEVAAQCNGTVLNFSNVARDTGVDVKTAQSYFSILEDTLIGFFLEPFHQSLRRRQRQAPKFYFFDTGVKRALDLTLMQQLVPSTYGFGKTFEHFVLLEIHRLIHYRQPDYRCAYLLTKDGAEIDLIVERPGMPTALIEIKSTERAGERDVRHVARFVKDFRRAEGFCFSLDPVPKKIGGVEALHWKDGLRALGL